MFPNVTINAMNLCFPQQRPLSSSLIITICLAFSAFLGCQSESKYPNRPITLVCPWAAGGGTDRVSRQMAAHLEQELAVPVNVINATGGKGVTGHNRGMTAAPDGYTVTMITLELNTMHWSGLTNLTYNDCIPLYTVNEDYAALYVRTDAKWNTLQALEKEIRANPGQLKASGTASGGAWHLGIVGWLISSDMNAEDITWISSTGAGPSLQELISGGLDMVCCSLPEARTLLDSGQIRALGLMAPKRAFGFDDVKTFQEQGTAWTLGAWRGVAVPKETPAEVVDILSQAVGRIVEGKTTLTSESQSTTFPQFMEAQKFDPTFRTGDDLKQFLSSTDAKFQALLTSEAMQSVNTDRFSPMIFPNILLGLMGCVLVGITISSLSQRHTSDQLVPTTKQKIPRRGLMNFGIIVGATLTYLLFVETVGFVLLSMAITLVMLCWLGTRLSISLTITIFFVPLVYQIFANVLRVPLPHGWWGW